MSNRCPDFLALSLLAVAAVGSLPAQVTGNTFLVHNLVSDLPNIADHQDTNLVNPWGNGFGTTPFWIGNNGSGTSTIYDGYGTKSALVVSIPAPGGATSGGTVTGVIFNTFSSNTSAFTLAAEKPASFLFCSEDGLIMGWNSSVDSTHAHVLFDNSASGAIYKGCALGGTASAPLLYAANFNSGNVDVFNGNLTQVENPKAFINPAVPAGFAPFNVQIIGGNVYVLWAKQDAAKHDDVAGAGNGYLAVFDPFGNLLSSPVSQGLLNSPWGLAIAPSTFVPFGGDLLIGNFGDGKINAYNPTTGAQIGTLNTASGVPIAIPGLWSINFGSGARNEDAGTLYFTAGIGGGPNNDPVESHGLLGSIQAVPSFTSAAVESAASFVSGPIAANEWISITGAGLSATTGAWAPSGTQLPTTLNGVSVMVNNEAAPVSFVGNTQINLLVPADIQAGTPAQIQVTNNGLVSATVSVAVQSAAPAFFIIGTNATTGAHYIAATHANGTLIGPATITGATPAEPGETIVLYGAGFGATSPATPKGQPITSPLALPVLPLISIDGFPATVQYAGLTGTGLYQINVVVPQGVQRGADDLTVALLGDAESQPGAYLTIAAQ
jgi:uncharacterized protein (TIGR03118 family)